MGRMLETFVQAVKSGDLAAVTMMLSANAELANQTEGGVPLTMLAVYYGHADVGRTLAEHKAEVSHFEHAALGHVADVAAALESNTSLIDQHSSDGFTALGYGAYFGHLELVAKLLSLGANPNIRSNNALAVAPLHSALAGGQTAIALLLIQGGADVNVPNGENWTPLHYCADIGDAELAELILERGANHLARDKEGRTAAELAADVGHDHVADVILQHLEA